MTPNGAHMLISQRAPSHPGLQLHLLVSGFAIPPFWHWLTHFPNVGDPNRTSVAHGSEQLHKSELGSNVPPGEQSLD